jgi:hypothetical protein
MTFHEVAYEEGSDEHDTPIEFFAPIADAVGGFDFDPCASDTSDLAEENNRLTGGLERDWYGKTFMNPPYSEVSDWMKYASYEHEHGHTDLIVGLVFARTGTQWFHNYARSADMLCFVEGRLCFGNQENSAPTPSMVAVWGDYPSELESVLERKGMVVYP